jgi:uncharacterized membrane protein
MSAATGHWRISMYLVFKVIHVLGVIAFLGNISTGLFWHSHAWRTRDPKLLAHTMAGIMRSDRLFTTPGVLMILAAGIAAAAVGHIPMMRTGWIFWTIVLFVAAGAIFGTRIAPLQRKLHALAAPAQGPFDEAQYAQLATRWRRWGALAVLLPLVGVALMVLKPAL